MILKSINQDVFVGGLFACSVHVYDHLSHIKLQAMTKSGIAVTTPVWQGACVSQLIK